MEKSTFSGIVTFHTLLKGLDIYLTHSQPIQDFGAKTWSAQLSSYRKRQIPGVGRNVYVWQLNAVRPTTGLILHPGNGGHKSLTRKTSRSLLPCLWLPPDALSLDAPWIMGHDADPPPSQLNQPSPSHETHASRDLLIPFIESSFS